MNNLREYGNPPFGVAVIHGGPGAPGEMAPVARDLSSECGVLEPLQTAMSPDAQTTELSEVLRKHGAPPVILIGWSWGAWLGLLCAARYPALVKKLLLVSCPPFEEAYASEIMRTRTQRLVDVELRSLREALMILEDPTSGNEQAAMINLARLTEKADSLDPLPHEDEVIQYQPDTYRSVWPAAARMRRDGEFLAEASRLRCPVLAIHGDYDPHPAAGVDEPLSRILPDLRVVVLPKCGHRPWFERSARKAFFEILRREISNQMP